MAKKVEKYPVFYIEWEDAEHDGTWSDLEDEKKHQLGLCYSVGWLIHENEKRIILACSVSQTEIGNKQYIPVAMITKRVLLREKRDAKRKRPEKAVVDNGSGSAVPTGH